MPLISIRPTLCGTYIGTSVPPIGDQIFRHYKYTPKEYHDVFSNPHKMFAMNIITPHTFRKIIKELPGVFDTSLNYIIDFMFSNYMWDIIPCSTPFNLQRLDILENYLYTDEIQMKLYMDEKKIISFMKDWISRHNNKEKSKDLIIGVMKSLKKKKWDTIAKKKSFICLVESLGDIGEEYSIFLKKEFDEYENNTRFNISPPSVLSNIFTDLKEFSRITNKVSYEDLCKMIESPHNTIKDLYERKDNSESGSRGIAYTGYGSYDYDYDYDSDDDTLSPCDDDDDHRVKFIMDDLGETKSKKE